MNLTERQKEILKLIEENTYISVNELAESIFISPSSVRRDLEYLQNVGLVRRSHGGAALPQINGKVAGFYQRKTKNVKEKRLIAQKAAALLQDGQSILLDSSSSAGFLLPHIARLESATVFTSNLETALNALKLGIRTSCIGGFGIGGSVSLGGSQAYNALLGINADVLFFSSQSLSECGMISDSTEDENFVRQIMLKHAKTTVFLCDSEKFDTESLFTLASLDDVDFAVFDKPYPSLKTKATVL